MDQPSFVSHLRIHDEPEYEIIEGCGGKEPTLEKLIIVLRSASVGLKVWRQNLALFT